MYLFSPDDKGAGLVPGGWTGLDWDSEWMDGWLDGWRYLFAAIDLFVFVCIACFSVLPLSPVAAYYEISFWDSLGVWG